MEEKFYGVKAEPPTKSLAEAFGVAENPIPLEGGQNTNYIAGNIVLKPADDIIFNNWMAEVFESFPDSPFVRFSRPIKSSTGTWVYERYVAWSFLKGKHVNGHYEEKLHASIEFHKLLKNLSKPDFIDTVKNSWSIGNLVAWQKLEFNYDQDFMDLYNQIKPYLKPLDLPFQLVHGDLLGNFLCDQNLPPAIIDFSPAWAPNGFAEGIMFADAIAWENANPKILEVFNKIPNFDQFAWRGVLRRITEQAEHIKMFDKDKKHAIEEAKVYQKVIDCLKNY